MHCRFIVSTVVAAAFVAGLWLVQPRPAAADDVITTHLGKKIANLAFTMPMARPRTFMT